VRVWAGGACFITILSTITNMYSPKSSFAYAHLIIPTISLFQALCHDDEALNSHHSKMPAQCVFDPVVRVRLRKRYLELRDIDALECYCRYTTAHMHNKTVLVCLRRERDFPLFLYPLLTLRLQNFVCVLLVLHPSYFAYSAVISEP
jgi:hypothetical protein